MSTMSSSEARASHRNRKLSELGREVTVVTRQGTNPVQMRCRQPQSRNPVSESPICRRSHTARRREFWPMFREGGRRFHQTKCARDVTHGVRYQPVTRAGRRAGRQIDRRASVRGYCAVLCAGSLAPTDGPVTHVGPAVWGYGKRPGCWVHVSRLLKIVSASAPAALLASAPCG